MFFNLEPNRIIIVSHLSADFSISQKGLWEYRAYSRRYRNRRIDEFLKEMHLTEERNTGFRQNPQRLNAITVLRSLCLRPMMYLFLNDNLYSSGF
mgnify:CR=1 FL=1